MIVMITIMIMIMIIIVIIVIVIVIVIKIVIRLIVIVTGDSDDAVRRAAAVPRAELQRRGGTFGGRLEGPRTCPTGRRGIWPKGGGKNSGLK